MSESDNNSKKNERKLKKFKKMSENSQKPLNFLYGKRKEKKTKGKSPFPDKSEKWGIEGKRSER